MPAFLDPKQPIITCDRENCADCLAGNLVHCHFRGRDLVHFLLNAFPPFIVGGAAIVRMDWRRLVLWLLLIPGYFGLLEIRVMCSHCPHYAEEGSTLRCWANYGSPKIWSYRPGSMSRMERFWFFAGIIALLGYALIFILLGEQWLLLTLFLATMISAGATL